MTYRTNRKTKGKFKVPTIKLETIPSGECFDYTFKRALQAIKTDEPITIVHANVVFWGSHQYPHAWVENDNLVQDWQTMILGTSNFSGVGWDKELFYKNFTPTHIQRYTPEQVMKNTFTYKHMGPWA